MTAQVTVRVAGISASDTTEFRLPREKKQFGPWPVTKLYHKVPGSTCGRATGCVTMPLPDDLSDVRPIDRPWPGPVDGPSPQSHEAGLRPATDSSLANSDSELQELIIASISVSLFVLVRL